MKKTFEKENYKFSRPIDVRWGDFDMLGHVNNATYFTFLENARIHYLQAACQWNWDKYKMVIAHISMDYIIPIVPGNKPYAFIRCIKIGNTSFILDNCIANADGNELYCSAQTVLVSINGATGKPISLPEEHVGLMKKYDALV
jgi:acyl-CoA thioester hydrolase